MYHRISEQAPPGQPQAAGAQSERLLIPELVRS
jgi:hypothetical protein